MACRLEGVHFDALLEQYELLWAIWKQNISRRGRSVAGAVGVWGLLTRNAKVKRNRFEIAELSVRVRAPPAASVAGGGAADGAAVRPELSGAEEERLLMRVGARKALATTEKTQRDVRPSPGREPFIRGSRAHCTPCAVLEHAF